MAKLFRRTPEDNQGLFQHRTQSCHAATADSLRVQAGQCSGPRLGRRSHRLWSLGSAEDNSGSRDPEPKRLPDAQQRSDPLDDAQRNQRAAKGDRRTEEPNTAVAISFTPVRQQAPSLSARSERINKIPGVEGLSPPRALSSQLRNAREVGLGPKRPGGLVPF